MDMILQEHYRVCEIYQVVKCVGAGSFGQVYIGFDTRGGGWIAIKLHIVGEGNSIPYEALIYDCLRGLKCIPTLRWSGVEGGLHLLVMDRLGPTLSELLKFCRGRFSLHTVCMLAEQLLTAIEGIHERGILLRDIKPRNMVMGLHGDSMARVHFIDFGLARSFIDPENDRHISFATTRPWVGTRDFVSVNAHHHKECSRRDDLESLGYSLLFFLNGGLPWRDVVAPDEDTKEEYVVKMKSGAILRGLLGKSGPEFETYFELVRNLTFDERPDYTALKELFRRRMVTEKWAYNCAFDWTSVENAPHGTLLPDEYALDRALVQEKYVALW
ncbi:kinase-like domain-containing protein [Trametes meyenii]|nr:kinase-like domain-containing protein [Trametes meyenii]